MNKLSQNVSLNFTKKIILGNKNVHHFLTYLKLRAICKNYGGNIPNDDILLTLLDISKDTLKRHFKSLIELGWIRKNETNNQIVSMYQICLEIDTTKKTKMFELNDKMIMNFSWRNIATFKAVLSEMLVEDFSKYQTNCYKRKEYKKLIDNNEGYKNLRKTDLASYKRRVGKQESKYFALSLSSQVVNKSITTIASYRDKLSSLVEYNNYIKFRSDTVNDVSLNDDNATILKYDLLETLNHTCYKQFESQGILAKSDFGYYFYSKGDLKFQECSRRFETRLIKSVTNNSPKFKPLTKLVTNGATCSKGMAKELF